MFSVDEEVMEALLSPVVYLWKITELFLVEESFVGFGEGVAVEAGNGLGLEEKGEFLEEIGVLTEELLALGGVELEATILTFEVEFGEDSQGRVDEGLCIVEGHRKGEGGGVFVFFGDYLHREWEKL